MYAVKFAPDGNRYQTIKKGTMGKIWDYFNFNSDLREMLSLNPQAKFQMINIDTKVVIGTLPRK
ncbi:hypothetical protein ES705_26168 [subsurface metagenome]